VVLVIVTMGLGNDLAADHEDHRAGGQGQAQTLGRRTFVVENEMLVRNVFLDELQAAPVGADGSVGAQLIRRFDPAGDVCR
jgi:hypothetical protein